MTLHHVQAREVGDGNLNFVYIVEGPEGGLVVKQALPFLRLVGDDWPLGQVGRPPPPLSPLPSFPRIATLLLCCITPVHRLCRSHWDGQGRKMWPAGLPKPALLKTWSASVSLHGR